MLYILVLFSFILWFFIYKSKFSKLKELWKTKWDITTTSMGIDTIILFLIFFISAIIFNYIISLIWLTWSIKQFMSIAGVIFPILVMYFWLRFLIKRHNVITDISYLNKLADKIVVWVVVTQILWWFLLIILWLGVL